MSWWSQSRGKVKIDATAPRAYGTCDQCGWQYSLSELKFQFQYAGPRLVNTNFRVCPDCYDQPSHRAYPYAVPADPVPVDNPRIENFAAEAANYIATQSGSRLVTEDGSFLIA